MYTHNYKNIEQIYKKNYHNIIFEKNSIIEDRKNVYFYITNLNSNDVLSDIINTLNEKPRKPRLYQDFYIFCVWLCAKNNTFEYSTWVDYAKKIEPNDYSIKILHKILLDESVKMVDWFIQKKYINIFFNEIDNNNLYNSCVVELTKTFSDKKYKTLIKLINVLKQNFDCKLDKEYIEEKFKKIGKTTSTSPLLIKNLSNIEELNHEVKIKIYKQSKSISLYDYILWCDFVKVLNSITRGFSCSDINKVFYDQESINKFIEDKTRNNFIKENYKFFIENKAKNSRMYKDFLNIINLKIKLDTNLNINDNKMKKNKI